MRKSVLLLGLIANKSARRIHGFGGANLAEGEKLASNLLHVRQRGRE